MYNKDGVFQPLKVDRMLDNRQAEHNHVQAREYLAKAIAETFYIFDKPKEGEKNGKGKTENKNKETAISNK